MAGRSFWPLATLAVVVHLASVTALCCTTVIMTVSAWHSLTITVTVALSVLAVNAGLVHAAWRIARTVRAEIVLRRRIGVLAVPSRRAVDEPAVRAGLTGRLVLLKDEQPFALTFGLLRPRVLVSTGLAEILQAEEMHAVLVHESAHVRRRDPLRNLLLDVLAGRYFFLPALQQWADRLRDRRELTADRFAIRRCGVRAVAGALLKVVETPQWGRHAAASAMGSRLLDARIDQLESGRAALPHRVSLGGLIATVAGAVPAAMLPVMAWTMSGGAAGWCCLLLGG